MTALHHHGDTVPRGALGIAGALVALSLLLTAAVRTGLLDPSPSAATLRSQAKVNVVTERNLRFADAADGSVLIEDVGRGGMVARFGEEGSGFIRGVMRGLARERRMHGVGQAPPFRLALWADGALTLTDTATGRIIELGGFGPDNRAAFARLLERTAT